MWVGVSRYNVQTGVDICILSPAGNMMLDIKSLHGNKSCLLQHCRPLCRLQTRQSGTGDALLAVATR